jgi:tripeptidyl-peptidase II
MPFKPGHIERRWVAVPPGANWASQCPQTLNLIVWRHANGWCSVAVRAISRENDRPLQLWLALDQLIPLRRLPDVERAFIFALNDGEPVTRKIRVVDDVPLEVAIVQGWNSISSGKVSLEIDFHGIEIANGRDSVVITGGVGLYRVEAKSSFRVEPFAPSLTFDSKRTFVRPSENEIRPLTERDDLLNGQRLQALVLTYKIKVASKQKAAPSWAV